MSEPNNSPASSEHDAAEKNSPPRKGKSRPLNSISFVDAPYRQSELPFDSGAQGRSPGAARDEAPVRRTPLAQPHEARPAPSAARASRADRPDAETIPAEVQERFIRVGNTFYFENGAEAFKDHGTKLTTRSENAEVARVLVQFAPHRGYEEIKVEGTERFKRQVWRAAFLAGIEVRNYAPTEFERARMVRELARTRRESRAEERTSNDVHREREVEQLADDAQRPTSSLTQERARRSGNTETKESREGRSRTRRDDLYVGQLIDYGPASYQFERDGEPSYFVKLKTAQGAERMLWGKDFERAIAEGITHPQRGDQVGVRALGKKPVTVLARERDDEGRVIREAPLDTHRNAWVVEKVEHFRDRAQAAQVLRDASQDPKAAVRAHAALAGSYVALKAGEEWAKHSITDGPKRAAFLAGLRERLAAEMERGDRPPSAAIVERNRTPPRAPQERVQEYGRVPG